MRNGERLAMTDAGMTEEPRELPSAVAAAEGQLSTDQTLIARFRHDLDTRKLQIKPLSIVTRDRDRPADAVDALTSMRIQSL